MNKNKKTLILLGAPLAAVAATGVAYAATLTVTTATAGAAQQAVNSCAQGAVTTSYPAPTDTGSGFTVASITVTLSAASPDDRANCAGKKIYVTLTDGSAVIASGVANAPTILATQAAYSINLSAFASGKSMADVSKTDIAIQ